MSGEDVLGRRVGGLWDRPLTLGWPESKDDCRDEAKLCNIFAVASSWKDAWPSLLWDRQKLGKARLSRELDRAGLEQGRLDCA